MRELEKTYDPSIVEGRLYQKWVEKGYFHAEANPSKEPFCIVMPPPNITGQLHMGHALDNTFQDILIRWKRMQGFEALWQPGTDHASIATEVKIVKKMAEEGLTKDMLGREGFMKRAWEWKEEYGNIIIDQLKKLGSSCDWERERFTLDEGVSDAVLDVFVKYYEKGYIYQGSKIINWCPVCKTSISEAEVEHEENNGHLYHIKYPIIGSNDFMCLATTRPETMLGDVAVAVHPEDMRYAHLVGKKVMLPIVKKEIPIISDYYVDKEFGTGVVKITPAHDPNDFEVGARHSLPQINVLNDDGTINENGGEFTGLDRYEARKRIVKQLQEEGYLEKIADHLNNVGTHDRCNTVIEPMIKQQWFVKMEELAKPALEAAKSGELKLVPERYNKIYSNWLENIHDWCISRQLWWGHRIPAYYCLECGHIMVQKEAPKQCDKCHSTDIKQDEDSLDTWFSSALWPFSTLGWPQKTPEVDYFYPNSVLVTSYDIIFFWVIRMVFSGLELTGQLPFKTVLFHGLLRDSQGRKMSKSLGNGIDPLEVIEKYGADSLRFTLVTGNAPGNDMRFYNEKVEASRNFGNKIWNASRFMMMNFGDGDIQEVSIDQLTPADKWILSKANTLTKEVTENMDNYDLGIAVQKLYDFIWEEFCDWYIEMVKPRLFNETDTTKAAALWTLKTVLIQALKLLHPYMPFITEEIFTNLQNDEPSIMISSWPVFKQEWHFEKEEAAISLLKEGIRNIRNVRAGLNVPPSKKAKVIVVSEDEGVRQIFEEGKVFFATLGYASEVVIQATKEGIEDDAVSTVIPNASIFMPFAELVDLEKEMIRLKGEKDKLQKELDRVKGKLENESFMSKAPEKVVKDENEKLQKYAQMMEQVEERIGKLRK